MATQPFSQYDLAQAGFYPDPTQWSNQFSNFNNAALPPTSYVPPATNWQGMPIQGQPQAQPQAAAPPNTGTTLNSSPGVSNQVLAQLLARPASPSAYSWGNNQSGYDPGLSSTQALAALNKANPPQQPAATQPAATSGVGQSYLSALANPGYIQTPGANVPFSMGFQPSGGVFNSMFQGGGFQPSATAAPPGIGGGSAGLTFGGNPGFMSAIAALQGMGQGGGQMAGAGGAPSGGGK